MTGWRLIALLGAVTALAACAAPDAKRTNLAGGAYTQVEAPRAAANQGADRVTVRDEKGVVDVQKVPFQAGVSTVTVERMARQAGCEAREGAGLLTEKGPVEIYRVQCTNGSHFMAQCELRQCRPYRR